MIYNTLVDSTQLNSDLEDVADAIRAKSGGSSQLAFPAGFISAIQAIPTGGTTPTGTKNIIISSNGTTTEDVEAYANASISVSVPNTYAAGDEGKVVSNGALVAQTSDSVTTNGTFDTTLINSLAVNVSGGASLAALFSAVPTFNITSCTLKEQNTVFDFGSIDVSGLCLNKVTSAYSDATVEIKCNNLAFGQSAISDYRSSSTLRTLTLTCTGTVTTAAEFSRETKITRILGTPLTVTDLGSNNYRIFNSTNLTEFYLIPNKVTNGGSGINTGVLIDASLVSVANALSAVTGQTLTISNATTKAKCNTIVGTVSQVTSGGETYDFFTQDASGTVTLSDFITQTKGWTLA